MLVEEVEWAGQEVLRRSSAARSEQNNITPDKESLVTVEERALKSPLSHQTTAHEETTTRNRSLSKEDVGNTVALPLTVAIIICVSRYQRIFTTGFQGARWSGPVGLDAQTGLNRSCTHGPWPVHSLSRSRRVIHGPSSCSRPLLKLPWPHLLEYDDGMGCDVKDGLIILPKLPWSSPLYSRKVCDWHGNRPEEAGNQPFFQHHLPSKYRH